MDKRIRVVGYLCLAVFVLAPLAGCKLGNQNRSAQQLPDGWQERSLNYDGMTRWYRIYNPDPVPENAPVVLYLHGGTLSMRSLFSPFADSSTTWFKIAEEEGVILLVPNGVNPKTGETYGNDQTWNDLRPDDADGQTQVDDVGFLLRLLDEISAELPINLDEVFVTGASNGGMMTYRLLIEAPERFRAGAVYIANLPDLGEPLPAPASRVPILIMNGTQDMLMPYYGGQVAKDRGRVISTGDTAAWWITANAADEDRMYSHYLPDLDPEDDCRIQEVIYPGGAGGAEVRLYTMEGGGHTLPTLQGSGPTSRLLSRLLGPVCHDVDGVQLAWDFFRESIILSSP